MMEKSPKNDRKRCVNIDWLELFVHEPKEEVKRDAQYYRRCGYEVSERDYGTRVYREMFTIMDEHGNPFLEVRRNPASDVDKNGGLFPAYASHVRLCNNACYAPHPIETLRCFLARHGYYVVKIFRLDVCCDFEFFDRGDDPAKFIQRYMEGKYSKVYQSNVSAHGVDTWQKRVWNSFSWGAKGSMIETKFYCKSMELSQVHDKPYIRYAWFKAGLIDDYITNTRTGADGKPYTPVIWRVEFSIHASAKRWFIIEDTDRRKRTDIYMHHCLEMYDTPTKMATVFASLAHHYFRFKFYEENKRKDRCTDKILFDFSYLDDFVSPDRSVSPRPCSTLLVRLRNALNSFKLTSCDKKAVSACDTLLSILDEKQAAQFVAGHLTAEDVLILQRLMAERSAGLKETNITTQRKRIQENVQLLIQYTW